ncbi:MAG: molybdopterin-dependent oxidoreductase, partial [Nitrospinae bacterium]|nr:molybdopterin-dependent oxidoreductase [Nitrospinota bacterium]
GSPYGTNEELYLYQKLFRTGIGTNNIDHKTYADTPGLPISHCDFTQVEKANLILLVASDPTEEVPILDLRIKKAVTRLGARLAVLNDQRTELDKFACQSLRYNVGSGETAIEALTQVLSRDLGLASGPVPKDVEKTCGIGLDRIEKLSESIRTSLKVCVVYNPASLEGNAVHALKALLSVIQQVPTIECGAMPAAPGTNSVGAMDMGVLPDFYPGGVPLTDADAIKQAWGEKAPLERGLSALEMIEKARSGELKALVVYRSNPAVDFPGGRAVEEALKKLQLLVVHDMLETETARLAHYVLPSNGPACDEGTLTNIGGRVQYRRRGLVTHNPPDWKIVSLMARELGDAAAYKDPFAVTAEISAKVPAYAGIDKKSLKGEGKNRGPMRYVEGDRAPSAPAPVRPEGGLRLRVSHYLFARDKILDASSPLAHHFKPGAAYLHPDDARALGVKSGDEAVVVSGSASVKVAVEVADRCNPGAVVLPRVSDEQGVFSLMNGSGPVAWVQIKK